MRYSTCSLFALAACVLPLAICGSLQAKDVAGEFTLECKTTSTAAELAFEVDTAAMLELVFRIKDCGKTHLYHRCDTNAYKDCLSALSLPETYESKFEELKSANVGNKIDFKKAVKDAAQQVCKDLNEKHMSDTYQRIYNVSRVTGGRSELAVAEEPHAQSFDRYSHINSWIFYLIGTILSLLIIISTVVYLIRKRKTKKEAAVTEVTNTGEMGVFDSYGFQESQGSQNSSFYDPAHPPSYRDVKN